MTDLEQIERDLGHQLMTLAAAGTLKAGDGGRTQLLAMVRRLYVEGCLVGDSVDRERKWQESVRSVVVALGQVIEERKAA